ncbi:MAG: hypothetical protein [Bacteriophage sp.]|nr:MAG: hypothetical protein [Bacteriophage sp.]
MINLFEYDESSPSCLRWKVSRLGGRGIKAGDVAGSIDSKGYWRVGVAGKEYRAHRIVYHIVTGNIISEDLQVDHIDKDRANNRISNLRLVTNQQNQFNKNLLSNNTSGITGVVWYKITNKWKVQMRVNKRTKHLGYFETLLDAACCRKSAELSYQRI